MRNKNTLDVITISVIVWALIGAVVTLVLFIIIIVPLALLIKVLGG